VAGSTPAAVFDSERKRQEEKKSELIGQDGSENPITIWRELGEVMTEHVTVTPHHKDLELTDGNDSNAAGALQEKSISATARSGQTKR